MATVALIQSPGPDVRTQTHSWEGFAASADVGTAARVVGAYGDKTVQVMGTFAGGLSILIEGSLDGGTTYFQLTDVNNVAIAFTAAGGKAIAENVSMIRPRATAGSASDVDVYIFSKLG